MRRLCGDSVQYFTYAKGTNGEPVDICCYCCSPDDLLTVDAVKKLFDCGGQQPLRLCASCAELEIKPPPMTNTATSFVEKKQQRKATKKRQAGIFQAIGGKKTKES